MDHLLVVAHPLIDSVTLKLARAYAAELEALGHRLRTHDLYRMAFNPVMTAEELEPLSRQAAVPAEVAEAQIAIRAADALTVFYPLWWASMPAILKGYIDRVFARGFAYEAEGGQTQALLTGKQCILVTLSGSPMSLLQRSGEWSAIDALQDTHVFRSSGFNLLEHLHIDSVEPPITPEKIAVLEARVRACARRHFTC